MRKILLVFPVLILLSCGNKTPMKLSDQNVLLFFNPYNWQVIRGSDTTYIFFSPINDTLIETISYRILRGDSIASDHSKIELADNIATWNFKKRNYTFTEVHDSVIQFLPPSHSKLLLESDSVMRLQDVDGETLFKKTLPLSTFLIRQRHDFENSLRLTDSGEVMPRPTQSKTGRKFK